MSISLRIGALTDELVAAVAKSSDKNPLTTVRRAAIERKIKDNSYLKTNKFEVMKSLDGLLEKFQVVGNDELSDALHQRLEELDQKRLNLAPEILSLLLLLSDNPATLTDLESLKEFSLPKTPKILQWADLNDSELNEPDDLWKDIDYAAESSDDDISSVSSGVSIPKIVPHGSTVPLEEFYPSEDLFIDVQDDNLIASIIKSQAVSGRADAEVPLVTELHIVKDAISMLRGLPTSTFSIHDDKIGINRNVSLSHTSQVAFQNLIGSFRNIGTSIQALRLFLKRPQRVPFMQTFQKEVEALVSSFDRYLSNEQSHYLYQPTPLSVSLLRLLHKVRRRVKVLLELARLIDKLNQNRSRENFRCLDLLYDLVCEKQAAGEDGQYREISRLFFACFENYTKPIRRWMQTGDLDVAQSSSFFVSTSTNSRDDLQTLWHDWFSLNWQSGCLYAPKFLHPSSKKIFTTGKSRVFLRHLGIEPLTTNLADPSLLHYDAICPSNQSLSLYPFAGRLDAAFNQLVDTNHIQASSLLKSELDEKCGLWQSFDALEYLYLGKDYGRYSVTDYRVFDLIDRGSRSWNDRFLITEFLRQAFSGLPCIDVTRLIGRSAKIPLHVFDSHSRSVQILKVISVDYTLPWPVANIVTKDSLNIYKRISLLLMQLRRGKYTLEKRWFTKPHLSPDDEEERADRVLSFCVRHRLLWALNVLYHHFTEVVIARATREMVKAAKASADVDSMIEIHQSYIKALEAQCLLSKDFAPIHHALISLLDLCISFSDTQVARSLEYQQDQNEQSLGTIRLARMARKRLIEDESDGESDMEISMFEVGNATSISFFDESYHRRVMRVKSKFDSLCSSIRAGLRVDHGDYSQSMETLADSLEWG
ncbi:hypothetical protein MGYG_04473 [Nannizzia gypsea CBS 118893]|uniref:Spindle pole body component n=1 Tax=Arthroderma gypseum (strain ATCC MYA-4604 / CBS 118893) TaxID=535722 RepID=E4UT69_ARTGP|nr:hypothetical protein MGYG_04473 [Nannizzia gypsea CBS 118893]EFR01465.1 hypothetical protein MGYG_04473 [Nannizzia gypsea CBS 118893]